MCKKHVFTTAEYDLESGRSLMEADEIRVSDKTFKRAARKAADEI